MEVRNIPKKKEPTKQPLKKMRGGGLMEEINEFEATVKDLKKKLKSEKSRAESYKRYRDKEKEECLETHDALRKAEKDRDDARDRMKELEKSTTKRHTIEIGAQTHYRKEQKDAVAHAKELLDADVWWITLGREE